MEQLVEIAGGEDESGSGAAVALGKGEAEAAGGSGDEDDLVALCGGAGLEGVGCGCRGETGEELDGEDGSTGLFHNRYVGSGERANGLIGSSQSKPTAIH